MTLIRLHAEPDDGTWAEGAEWREGKHEWPAHELELMHFRPAEFDRPELLDGLWLLQLDYYRHCLGFALRPTDDARTPSEQRWLYREEIEAGEPWPEDSPHVYTGNGDLVRAVDIRPYQPSEKREIAMLYLALKFHDLGIWPDLGLELATRHIHIDDTPRLGSRRPAVWPGTSK